MTALEEIFDRLEHGIPSAFEDRDEPFLREDDDFEDRPNVPRLPPDIDGHRSPVLDPETPVADGRFPKNPGNWEPRGDLPDPEETQLPPGPEIDRREPWAETLAWYRPRHIYPRSWGIYVREAGIVKVARRLLPFIGSFPAKMRTPINAAYAYAGYFLYRHEATHFAVEMFATQAELSGRPVYLPYHRGAYLRTVHGANCLEETHANVMAANGRHFAGDRWDGILKVIEASPASYAAAKDVLTGATGAPSPAELADQLAQQILQATDTPHSLPGSGQFLLAPGVPPSVARYSNVPARLVLDAGGVLSPFFSGKATAIRHRFRTR
jgi:hypothetical protein